MTGNMELAYSLILLAAGPYVVLTVTDQSVTRCYNEKFDSLMCLPGTGILVQRIHVYASTTGGPTGLCHRSLHNCTEKSPPNRDFPIRARAACDGRLTCDNLTAGLDKVYCEVPDRPTRVDLSYITIQYTCEHNQTNDFRYVTSCFNQTFDNLTCDGGTVIDVTDVYVGVTDVTTGGCSMVPVGGCVRHFPDNIFLAMSYRVLCDGRVECGDARAYATVTGICRPTSLTEYTIVVYQCVPPVDTTVSTIVIPDDTTTLNQNVSSESSTAMATTKHVADTTGYTTDTADTGSMTASSTAKPDTRGHSPTGIIIAVPVAGVCLVIGVVLVVCLIKRKKRKRDEQVFLQSDGVSTQDAQNYALATNHNDTDTGNSREITPYSATLFANKPNNNSLKPNKNSHGMTQEMSDAPYTYDDPVAVKPPRKPSAVARGNVGTYAEVQLDAANVVSASDPTGAIDGIQLETYPSGTRGDVNKVAMGTDDPGVTGYPADVYSDVVKPTHVAARQTGDGQEEEDDTVIVDNALYG